MALLDIAVVFTILIVALIFTLLGYGMSKGLFFLMSIVWTLAILAWIAQTKYTDISIGSATNTIPIYPVGFLAITMIGALVPFSLFMKFRKRGL